ncbi:ABC-type uncharacterized transport system%2C periplasmic component [Bordetella ansorpii]|uniref:ABC-type uncharacterized transport system, periplasmic component n=1 Tax=Bordetella ansorpii TaxID=288768 RepID=A0A157SLA3_9BORD|nr:DUF1007 family protein [Bordetella ansorpii]SAI71051.1 ABC-type uncharacterized transport system%2C periplasmic component [Bordetella ansorpii]
MFVLKYIRYFLFAFGLSSAASAWSHPHAWIDVRSTVLTSDTGLVAAIKEEWLFDELYTSYVVEETTENTKEAADSAARFAGKAVENLKPFGYFMKIRSDGRQIPIGAIGH